MAMLNFYSSHKQKIADFLLQQIQNITGINSGWFQIWVIARIVL